MARQGVCGHSALFDRLDPTKLATTAAGTYTQPQLDCYVQATGGGKFKRADSTLLHNSSRLEFRSSQQLAYQFGEQSQNCIKHKQKDHGYHE